MTSRRKFLKAFSLAAGAGYLPVSAQGMRARPIGDSLILSTWEFGMAANAEALRVLQAGGRALDAVEKGVMLVEADPSNTSVGLGGYPDRDGFVTLDACIMDEEGNAGSASFLQGFEHPISVARKIMEKTPHVMLSGEGARQFALEQGFKPTKRGLSPQSKEAWEKWKKENGYVPPVGRKNHDTIGMIVLSADGKLSGACTTSGVAFKYHGRVGDSPVIGAGLFVDPEVGAATATGLGEAVLRICGTHTIVELMRQGHTPQQACEETVRRIAKRENGTPDFQVGFLAVNLQGDTGAYALRNDFQYAITVNETTLLRTADCLQK